MCRNPRGGRACERRLDMGQTPSTSESVGAVTGREHIHEERDHCQGSGEYDATLLVRKDLQAKWQSFRIRLQDVREISQKFREMIDLDLRSQSHDGRNAGGFKIYIENEDPRIIDLVLKYAMGLETLFPASLILELIGSARKYEIKDLEEDLGVLALQYLTPKNFCKFMSCFGKLNKLDLVESCISKLSTFQLEDHLTVIESSGFFLLRQQDLQTLFASRQLVVSQDVLILRCRQWVNAQGFQNKQRKKWAYQRLLAGANFLLTKGSLLDHMLFPIMEGGNENLDCNGEDNLHPPPDAKSDSKHISVADLRSVDDEESAQVTPTSSYQELPAFSTARMAAATPPFTLKKEEQVDDLLNAVKNSRKRDQICESSWFTSIAVS
mmetsp:Transcript_59138/g.86566  ORF Transcript_59138/g.86566 Transcript_59138/m.86566 type:complete len:381 (+) Transcript_59138:99-1241(+)